SVHCRPPLRRRGFAHAILVTEKANFLECFFQRDSLQPPDRHEVLAAVWIIHKLPVVGTALRHVEHGNLSLGSCHAEVQCWRNTTDYLADANIATASRHIYPYPVVWVQKLQGLAVP